MDGEMILTAHQPAYLPWLGYFDKISMASLFVIMDAVQFEKNSFTNRNQIKGPNGAFWLTVPVKLEAHYGKNIAETEIDNTVDWRRKHLRSIEQCYSKAKFYNDYIEFFRDCYGKPWAYISELNEYMMRWFLKQLGIKRRTQRMSGFAFTETKSDLILEICEKFGAYDFISGALGRDYLDIEKHKSHGVRIYFQDYCHPVYAQLYGDFVPYMSIVDLLFNCGPDSFDIMRGIK